MLGLQPLSILVLLLVPGVVRRLRVHLAVRRGQGRDDADPPGVCGRLYGRARYASIAGALAAFVMGATALAPISAGAAYDLFHSYDPLFWAFVVLSAVPAGAVLLSSPVRVGYCHTGRRTRMIHQPRAGRVTTGGRLQALPEGRVHLAGQARQAVVVPDDPERPASIRAVREALEVAGLLQQHCARVE